MRVAIWFLRVLLCFVLGGPMARGDHIRYEWFIDRASPAANDGSTITMTGSGSFIPGVSDAAAGEGTWVTRNSKGEITDSGRYWPTQLLSWHLAPGRFEEDLSVRPGLAMLRIAYSNGSRGILVVSCKTPDAPPALFEGFTTSMGSTSYWRREEALTAFFDRGSTTSTTATAATVGDAVNASIAGHGSQNGSRAADPRWRWDIVRIQGAFFSGGVASARADDDSKITITGSGTFVPGMSEDVSGGGTWSTFNSKGDVTGGGAYVVTGLVDFWGAPGTLPIPDRIGTNADARTGLLALRIAYSDGSVGVLFVSCTLPGAPDSIFEGITVSKGFVHFWKHGGVTVFHAAPSSSAAPAISRSGIVNAGTNAPGPLAPNGIISIFGTNLAVVTSSAMVASGRLPNSLFGVRATIGPTSIPLIFVSPSQINAVLPSGLAAGTADVTVTVDNTSSAAERVAIAAAAPGIFTIGTSAVATHAGGSLIGRFPGATPARAGETITIYGTGFGVTSPPVGSGEVFVGPTPISQQAQVKIGSATVMPDYIGGTPNFAGLYQINVRLPADLPAGDHDVVVTVGGVSSPAGVKLAVQ